MKNNDSSKSWTDPNRYRNGGKFHPLLNILDSILKRRNVTLPTKLRFLFFQESCTDVRIDHKEGWVPKNWCFQIVNLEKTLESPLDCKRSNQSILKEINPEYSLEGLMLKLKLQYSSTLAPWCEESTHWKRPWFWERLKAKDKGAQESEQTQGDSEGQGNLVCCSSLGCKEVRHSLETEQQQQLTILLQQRP